MTDINKLNFAKRTLLYLFLSVPIISATISAFHLEGFMRLGNPTFLSVTTAIAYEIANVTAMFIFVMLPRINRSFVWISFIMLVVMQVVGNVFFSYDYIIRNVNPEHLSSWYSMTNYLFDSSNKIESSFYLACFIGVPVPLVAIFLTKSVSNYLGGEEESEEKNTIERKTDDEILNDEVYLSYAGGRNHDNLKQMVERYSEEMEIPSDKIHEPISKNVKNEKIDDDHNRTIENLIEEERKIFSQYNEKENSENEIVVGQDTLIDIPIIDEEIAVETNKEELNNTSDFNDKLEQRGLIIK
jgi:hypothetical protein